MKIIAGVNGFGRFGLHLLKYWIDRSREANFSIDYINDDYLTLKDVYNSVTNDKYVSFSGYKIQTRRDSLVITGSNDSEHVIRYTNKNRTEIPWLGQPDIFFECSGKAKTAENSKVYLSGKTKLVVISATCWDADKTLIYGFNHTEFNGKQRIISYGSCTVNAYVPLANFINRQYGVINSDVNVIHNVPEYKLKECNTLTRQFCTLEGSAPILLNFLSSHNFIVNYTMVPYTGVSMIDLRFCLKNHVRPDIFIGDLEQAFTQGELRHLYCFDEADRGPEAYIGSSYSAVLIQKRIRVLNDNVYLHGYFDNENSVNRFYDLVSYITATDKPKSHYADR